MSKQYQKPNQDQWRAFYLRENGLPFDGLDIENWNIAYIHNLNLDAENHREEDSPTDDDVIESMLAQDVQALNLSGRSCFSISLPNSGKTVNNIPALYEHLADLIEKKSIANVGAITLNQLLDNNEDYYPQLDVWLLRPIP